VVVMKVVLTVMAMVMKANKDTDTAMLRSGGPKSLYNPG